MAGRIAGSLRKNLRTETADGARSAAAQKVRELRSETLGVLVAAATSAQLNDPSAQDISQGGRHLLRQIALVMIVEAMSGSLAGFGQNLPGRLRKPSEQSQAKTRDRRDLVSRIATQIIGFHSITALHRPYDGPGEDDDDGKIVTMGGSRTLKLDTSFSHFSDQVRPAVNQQVRKLTDLTLGRIAAEASHEDLLDEHAGDIDKGGRHWLRQIAIGMITSRMLDLL